METYLQNSKSLHRILLLIDINTGVQASDNMLLDLLVEKSKPVSLVLTKSDKMKAKHVQKTTEAIIKEVQLKGLAGTMSPLVHVVSSYSGYGIHELLCGLC